MEVSSPGCLAYGHQSVATSLSSHKLYMPADRFHAMEAELDRRREECLQLRAMMADRAITTHSIGKESYGGGYE